MTVPGYASFQVSIDKSSRFMSGTLARSYSPMVGAGSRFFSDPIEPSQFTEKDLTEERSQWCHRLLSENPQLLATRERVLPWTGGHSFARMAHADRTASLSHMNRHRLLELVYQHLRSIGMHQTAETVRKESGHEFQRSDQPWDKTDLLMLASLGVSPREDPWGILPDPHHQIVEEDLEEDFFASRYREDPSRLYQELFDRDLNVVWKEGESERGFQQIKAASLRRLVVLLATSSNAGWSELKGPVMLDDDLHRFFLILHSITSSHHFFEHLMMLFDCQNLAPDDEEMREKLMEMRLPLRRNVINLLKKWTTFHGLFIGRQTIREIAVFLRRILDDPECNKGFDIHKIARPILDAIPKLTYGTKSGTVLAPTDPPLIPDPQIVFRPELSIVDPYHEEVARQITLMFHAAFRAVHSREFMVALGSQKKSHQTPTLAEFFDFGKRLTLLCLEAILQASDKNKALGQILEIAKDLDKLYNFAAAAAIVRALQCRELSSLPFWNQTHREALKRIAARSGQDPSNLDVYRKIVGENFNGWESTVPNLHVELQAEDSDRSPLLTEEGLINWEKPWNISKKAAVLYRFQNKLYSFWEIPQIQNVISRGPSMSDKQIEEALGEFCRS